MYFLWIIKFWSGVWFDFIWSGRRIPNTLFREHTSILQIAMHSFLWMPTIMDGVLISNWWDYPFMVTGQKTNQLHINILEIMAIHFELKKTIQYIHHSCVIISTKNTTVVSHIIKQGGTHSFNLCVEVCKFLCWCLEHNVILRICHIREIQPSRPSLKIRQASQYGMVLGSNGSQLHFSNAQISQCGFVCN